MVCLEVGVVVLGQDWDVADPGEVVVAASDRGSDVARLGEVVPSVLSRNSNLVDLAGTVLVVLGRDSDVAVLALVVPALVVPALVVPADAFLVVLNLFQMVSSLILPVLLPYDRSPAMTLVLLHSATVNLPHLPLPGPLLQS